MQSGSPPARFAGGEHDPPGGGRGPGAGIAPAAQGSETCMMNDGGTQPGSLRVALFAGLVEAAGVRTLELDWPGGTVSELRRALVAARPALAPLLARSAVAVAGCHAADDAPVAAGADVAILPPVSGG
jgi:molybdopterin converting factor small subunit